MLFTHERKVISTMKFNFNKNAQNEQNAEQQVELTEQELAQVNGACGSGDGHGYSYSYQVESYQNHHNRHHYYNPCHNYDPCHNPCNHGDLFN